LVEGVAAEMDKNGAVQKKKPQLRFSIANNKRCLLSASK